VGTKADFTDCLRAGGLSRTGEDGGDNEVVEKMRDGHLNNEFDDVGEGGGVASEGIGSFVWTENRGFGFDDLRGEGKRRTFWWNVPLISLVL
jgi:hypothetical protein